jgi:hypothetical protein
MKTGVLTRAKVHVKVFWESYKIVLDMVDSTRCFTFTSLFNKLFEYQQTHGSIIMYLTPN